MGTHLGKKAPVQRETNMKQFGSFNSNNDLGKFGFDGLKAVYWNYAAPMLYEEAISRKEGRIAKGGALVVETGQHTGRSAADKFIVRTDETENTIWWDNNKPMTPEAFALLKADMLVHARGKELFVQDLYGGADSKNRIASRIVTEFAWHSLFIRNLLIRPEAAALAAQVPCGDAPARAAVLPGRPVRALL